MRGRMLEIVKIEGKPDYSKIIDLINALWPEEFGALSDEEKIEEMDKSHNAETDTVKCLFEGYKIIGYYRYSLWPREDKETKQAHTFDVVLLPEYQRQGLGVMLMKDLIADCKNNGIKQLLSRSFKNNEGSIKLHRRLGFRLHLETDDSLVWKIEI
jgi:L-amino acid N-acyltransferase YncA